MKKTKFLLSILGLSMFVPVEVLAYQNDIKVSSIKSLTYKESVGNFLKFKMQDNKLYVNDEYTHLLQSELQKLYYKALESSSTTLTLAHELSKLSKKKTQKSSLKKILSIDISTASTLLKQKKLCK